jgi:hypothetical protein
MAGVIVLLTAVTGCRRLLREVRRALRAGFSWLPVMEAVADPLGDTGSLITGRREYVAVAPAARSQLRLWRLIAAACAFAAAVLPLPLLLVVVRLGAHRSPDPLGAAALMLLPSILLLALAWALRHAEGRLVRRPRGARPSMPKDTQRRIVTSWTESFDEARAGQPLGRRAPHPVVTRIIVSAALLAVIVVTLAMIPLALLTPVGDVITGRSIPKFSATIRKLRPVTAARGFGVAPDSTVTAATAGRILHALALAGTRRPEPGVRPPDPAMADRFIPAGSERLFGATVAFLQDSLLRRAAHGGFTTDQRRFLEDLARHPGFALVAVAARASRADLVGASIPVAALDTLSPWAFPVTRPGLLTEAAYARIAVAALRLSEGRRAEAEMLLREIVSLGIVLMESGSTMLEAWIGMQIAKSGLDRLATFYEVTGQGAAAARLRTVRDSALAAADREDEAEVQRANLAPNIRFLVDATRLRYIGDSTLPRGFRAAFLDAVSIEPCFSARQMVYGPPGAMLDAVAAFRRQALWSAADSAFFGAMTAGPGRFAANAGPQPGLIASAVLAASRAVGAVLGSRRFAECGTFYVGLL